MENIQQAVKSIAPTLKEIVIKKLFLHRYSWHQNAINHNLMSQDTSLCFIY